MAKHQPGKHHSVRIVDSDGHSEPFSAHSRQTLLAGLLAAIERYRARYPDTTRPRSDKSESCPLLQLHYLDPWGSAREGEPAWISCICPGNHCPLVSIQAGFYDGAAMLWACIEHTARQAEELAKFYGYHHSGENRLRDFFNACGEEDPQSDPQPGLRLVRGGIKPKDA